MAISFSPKFSSNLSSAIRLCTIVYLGLGSPLALAEDPEFAKANVVDEDHVDGPKTGLSVELGGVLAAGNVVYQTAQGRMVLTRRWEANGLATNITGNLGRSVVDADGDGLLSDDERVIGYQETARRLSVDLRYDRYVAKRSSIYTLAGALLDPFAGYDLRTHEQIGVSRKLVDQKKFKLISEIGFDYAQENYVDGIDPNYQDILAARIFLGAVANLSDNFAVTNDLEIFENVLTPADLRLLETLAVTSRISDSFTFKTSYGLVFDNIPVEGFRPLDQVVMVTLVASIL